MEDFIGEYVSVEVSGNRGIIGYLVDIGKDVLVLQQRSDTCYISLRHVHHFSKAMDAPEFRVEGVPGFDHPFRLGNEEISLRKVLLHARGQFVEINITGNTTIHGYLTSIMNDYFVFHSPVYKTMFITLGHLKWLVPYREEVTPYALEPEAIPHRSLPTSLPRTFKEQCQKLAGNVVVFDLGEHPDKIGQLRSVDAESGMIEMIQANGMKRLLNLEHVKAAYLP